MSSRIHIFLLEYYTFNSSIFITFFYKTITLSNIDTLIIREYTDFLKYLKWYIVLHVK